MAADLPRDLGSLVALIDARIAEKLGQRPPRSGVNIVAAWAGKWAKVCPSFLLSLHDHPGMLEELAELIEEDRRGAGGGDADGVRTRERGADGENEPSGAAAGGAAAPAAAARVLRPGDDGA